MVVVVVGDGEVRRGREREKRERESEGGVERREWISVGLGVSVVGERESGHS